jgi:hypothetical protein
VHSREIEKQKHAEIFFKSDKAEERNNVAALNAKKNVHCNESKKIEAM